MAKQCLNYGQRVQNFVFECQVDAAMLRKIESILEKIIDPEKGSLRFYNLGNAYGNKVRHIGAKPTFDVSDVLIV